MGKSESVIFESIGRNIARIRDLRALSQKELANRSRVNQVQISYFETGRRMPTISQLAALSLALETSIEEIVQDHPSYNHLADLAFNLRNLGLIDIRTSHEKCVYANRPTEHTIALALSGDEPESRIIEGIPAVFSWNVWDYRLLKAYCLREDRRSLHRAAWLADVVRAIQKAQGFPGGIRNPAALGRLVRSTRPPSDIDNLGRPGAENNLSPLWKKWNVAYPAQLDLFRTRAQQLHDSIQTCKFWRAAFEKRST